MNRTTETRLKVFLKEIEKRAKKLFNKDFFSIYEGIIEDVDLETASATITIPELDGLSVNNCRLMMPCTNAQTCISTEYIVGSHVIIGFKAFSLNYPVILGQINPLPTIYNSPADNGILLKNGDAQIIVKDDSIQILNGSSSIVITDSSISIDGSSVTAGSNNLKVDDIGSM